MLSVQTNSVCIEILPRQATQTAGRWMLWQHTRPHLGQDGLTLGIHSGVGREFRPLLVHEQDRQQARRGDVLAQAGCLGPNIFLPREKVDSWVFLQRGEDFHGRFALGSIHGSRRGCVGGLIV